MFLLSHAISFDAVYEQIKPIHLTITKAHCLNQN